MKCAFLEFDWTAKLDEVLPGLLRAMDLIGPGAVVNSVEDTARDAYVLLVTDEPLTGIETQGIFNMFDPEFPSEPVSAGCPDSVKAVLEIDRPFPIASRWEDGVAKLYPKDLLKMATGQ